MAMKTFAKISLIVSFIIALGVIVPYVSCNKDKCRGVSCEHGGTCNNGKCTCAVGYEGANCAVASRNKFLGNWTQTTSVGSPTSAAQFTVSISATGAGADSVAILNFGNIFTSPVVAYLTGSDTLVIPHQLLDDQIVQGYAYYVNNDIMVYYEDLNYVTNVLDTVYAKW